MPTTSQRKRAKRTLKRERRREARTRAALAPKHPHACECGCNKTFEMEAAPLIDIIGSEYYAVLRPLLTAAPPVDDCVRLGADGMTVVWLDAHGVRHSENLIELEELAELERDEAAEEVTPLDAGPHLRIRPLTRAPL